MVPMCDLECLKAKHFRCEGKTCPAPVIQWILSLVGGFLPKVSFPTEFKLLTMDQLLSVSKTTAVISVILRDYTL